jgi:hypothetical protein
MIKNNIFNSIHILFLLFFFSSCTGVRIRHLSNRAPGDTLTKNDGLFIKPFHSKETLFFGESSEDTERNKKEKIELEQNLGNIIASELQSRGFNIVTTQKNSKFVLEGIVVSLDRGSSTQRAWIGFGAGQSKLVVKVKIYNKKNLMREFEVLADSGSRQGVFSMGSFLKTHMKNTAREIATFLETKD